MNDLLDVSIRIQIFLCGNVFLAVLGVFMTVRCVFRRDWERLGAWVVVVWITAPVVLGMVFPDLGLLFRIGGEGTWSR